MGYEKGVAMSRLARRLIIVSVLVALAASVATFVILKRIQAGVAATKVALARKIKRGTKLTVVYLLENQYSIDLVAATAFGEDL